MNTFFRFAWLGVAAAAIVVAGVVGWALPGTCYLSIRSRNNLFTRVKLDKLRSKGK